MQSVIFQHLLVLFLWPQWLVMLSKKLRLVLAYSGVVPWDASTRVRRDGAIGFRDLFRDNGGNVPFQYQNRPIKCMQKILSHFPFQDRNIVNSSFGGEPLERQKWSRQLASPFPHFA